MNNNSRYALYTIVGLIMLSGLIVASTTITENYIQTPILNTSGIYVSNSKIVISRADHDATALDLMANETEGSVKIVFWATPDGTSSIDRIGQITAHGNLSGSTRDEMAWYMINESGYMTNRFKLLAQNSSQTELILTGATGIARSSGNIITLGESVLGGGVSNINPKSNLILENTKALQFKDSGDVIRTGMVLDNINDLYIKNEAAFANTPIIYIQNRNSANTLTTRLRIDYGDNPNITISNSVLKIDNLSGIGNAYVCVNSNGQLYRNTTCP